MKFFPFSLTFPSSRKSLITTSTSSLENMRGLLYEQDSVFNQLYDEGIKTTDTPVGGPKRKERFYNLVQFLNQILDLRGAMAECGCWKGLSSYLICNSIRLNNPDFRGQHYHIFDSFAGLSEPTASDSLPQDTKELLKRKHGRIGGAFQADVEDLRKSLSTFSDITFHVGWIPEIFSKMPEDTYKFVHIDLDLYQPIFGSLRYFYPRLVQGGMIICDDYGSLAWPGAKRAVEEYCSAGDISFVALSTGQALIWKK